jgi:hypothetical protein
MMGAPDPVRLVVDNDTGRPEVAGEAEWLRRRYAELSSLPDTAENRRRRFEILIALRSGSEEWRNVEKSEAELAARVEHNNRERLIGILHGRGWTCRREVPVAGRLGDPFRLDLLVSHPELPGILGTIEVKDSVGPAAKEYVDAVKQASDYVGGRTGDGEIVEWAAVYPVVHAYRWISESRVWGEDGHHARASLDFLSGVFELASKHLKVHALFHEPRSGMPRGDRAVLIYLNRHIIWCEERGFRPGAAERLCGKRQVGGQRR